MSVTWDDFNLINKLNKEVAFQQLAHYLFLHLHNISYWKIKQHSNQAGIEIEPIKVEIEGREVFASYQAKHFDNNIGWGKCKESVKVTVKKKREGSYANLERIDFYLNKDLGESNQSRDKIEEIAGEAGIKIVWHYGEELLLELDNPFADDELKAIVAKFFTGIEAGRQLRFPAVDIPLTKVVGRDELTAKIQQSLQKHQRIQLFGLPGIGKSTLAQYVAASEEAIFGTTIVSARDLSEAQGGESVEQRVQLLAEKAVSKFVEGRVEGDVLELAKELFRSDKRLLVIDNLEAPELIRGFIEAVRPARLLLTSRRQAAHYDLMGGASFQVDELSPDAAREQFYNDSGLSEDYKREAVDEICSLLGYLPLAINLLAVQIKSYFDGNPEEALNALQQKRLEYLERYGDFSPSPENDLRLSFELSYDRLKPEQKHIFQTMGVLMPSGTNLASIVYMSSLEEFPLKRALAELRQRSLVSLSEKKYLLHTLLWEYAKEKLEEEGDEEAVEARALQLIDELLEGYISETESVDLKLYDCYWEQAAYLVVGTQLDLEDFLSLADATYNYLTQTSQYWAALEYILWIIEIVPELRDQPGEVVYLDMLGSICRKLNFGERAVEIHEKGLKLAKERNYRKLEGIVSGNLGNSYAHINEYEKALEYHKESAKIARETGNKRGEGAAIGNQAIALRALGEPLEAYELSVISLFIARAAGYRKGKLPALASFANAVASLFGDMAARQYYEEALLIAEELENRSMQASLLRNIGRIEQGLGKYKEALIYFKQSFILARKTDESLARIQALGSMSEVSLSMNEPKKARRRHCAALAVARRIGSVEQEGIQLDCLGNAHLALDDAEEALKCHTEALALFEKIDYRRGIAAANGNIGHVYQFKEDYRKACEYFFSSLVFSAENQNYEGIGTSLADLGNVFGELSNYQLAATFWIAACSFLEQENKSYFEVLVERLTGIREEWQEFDEFIPKLVNGTDDTFIEDIREMGFLEGISQDYVMKLLKT